MSKLAHFYIVPAHFGMPYCIPWVLSFPMICWTVSYTNIRKSPHFVPTRSFVPTHSFWANLLMLSLLTHNHYSINLIGLNLHKEGARGLESWLHFCYDWGFLGSLLIYLRTCSFMSELARLWANMNYIFANLLSYTLSYCKNCFRSLWDIHAHLETSSLTYEQTCSFTRSASSFW